MKLIVGLGNPGPAYAETRHNAGFMVVDHLAEQAGCAFRDKFSAKFAEGRLGSERVMLLKPMTYMNESGRSVQPAAAFYKIPAADILVIHDELDVPFGQLRFKQGGGDAGHNGIKSVTRHLGTQDYVRLRFGVGRPPADFRGSGADYVLQAFAPAERIELSQLIGRAAEAVMLVQSRGLEAAMNVTNQRAKD